MPNFKNSIGVPNSGISKDWIVNTKSLHLDGSADYIDYGDQSFADTGKVQLSVWIKLDNLSSVQPIYSKGAGTANAVELSVLTNGKIKFTITTSSTAAIATTDDSINHSQWEHIQLYYYGEGTGNAGRVKISINGAAYGDITFSGAAIPTTVPDTGSTNCLVGRAGSTYLDGQINEFCYWVSPNLLPTVGNAWLADSLDGYIRNFFSVGGTGVYSPNPGEILTWFRFGDNTNDTTSSLKTYNSRFSITGTVEGSPSFTTDVPDKDD